MKAIGFLIFIFFISINLSAQTSDSQKKLTKSAWVIANIRGFMTDTLILKRVVPNAKLESPKISFNEDGTMEVSSFGPTITDAGMIERKKTGNWTLDRFELNTTIPILGIRKKYTVVKLTEEKLVLIQHD